MGWGPRGLTLPSLPRLHTADDATHWWLCAPLLLPPAPGFPLPQEEVGPVLSPALPWGTQHHLPKLWQLHPAAHWVPRGAVSHVWGMKRWVVVDTGYLLPNLASPFGRKSAAELNCGITKGKKVHNPSPKSGVCVLWDAAGLTGAAAKPRPVPPPGAPACPGDSL